MKKGRMFTLKSLKKISFLSKKRYNLDLILEMLGLPGKGLINNKRSDFYSNFGLILKNLGLTRKRTNQRQKV